MTAITYDGEISKPQQQIMVKAHLLLLLYRLPIFNVYWKEPQDAQVMK